MNLLWLIPLAVFLHTRPLPQRKPLPKLPEPKRVERAPVAWHNDAYHPDDIRKAFEQVRK